MLQAERLTLKILKFDTKNTSAFYLKYILLRYVILNIWEKAHNLLRKMKYFMFSIC